MSDDEWKCSSRCSCGKPCASGPASHSTHCCKATGGCATRAEEERQRFASAEELRPLFGKYNHLGSELREDLILLVSVLLRRAERSAPSAPLIPQSRADAMVAEEREACARVLDGLAMRHDETGHVVSAVLARKVASVIRARKEASRG